MDWNVLFLVNSVMLGIGLAMDAFAVSMANGLHEPKMRLAKMSGVAGVFAFFQALMPMMGWACVHTILSWGNCDREKTGNKARGQSRYFGRHYSDSDWCRNFCKRSILLRLLLKFKNLSKKMLTFLK